MYFYRPLTTIKAITFDLDDTLYDNTQCIADAEVAMITFMQQFLGLQHITAMQFKQIKQQLLQEQPEIYHDVITWRSAAIKRLLNIKHIPASQVERITEQTMHNFIIWRHKITVPAPSIQLLDYLAKKYPLAVITNGNVEVDKINIQHYFQFSLRGGPDGRAKPFPEMFHIAAKRLHIAPQHILHIGDNLITDVAGAVDCGMQACWINVIGSDIFQQSDAQILPHVEIAQLSELYNLL